MNWRGLKKTSNSISEKREKIDGQFVRSATTGLCPGGAVTDWLERIAGPTFFRFRVGSAAPRRRTQRGNEADE
jgi:hypothetical protein